MTCKEYKDRDIVYHCKAHRKGDRYVCECGLDEPYTRTDWEDLTQEQRDKIMDNVAKNHPSTENHSGAHGVQPFELEEFAITKGTTGIKHPQQKRKFYLVFNPNQSVPKYRHYTLEEALKEARRIAARHPEQTVYVLETISAYTAEITKGD